MTWEDVADALGVTRQGAYQEVRNNHHVDDKGPCALGRRSPDLRLSCAVAPVIWFAPVSLYCATKCGEQWMRSFL